MTLEIDFETRSAVSLPDRGAYVYFEDESTSVRIASYSFDGGATVHRWRWPAPCPDDIRDHMAAGRRLVLGVPGAGKRHASLSEAGLYCEAHAAPFEIQCFRWLHTHGEGWPAPELAQWRCTAAMAAAMGLPRGLDQLAQALGLVEQKDKVGYKLMLKMSAPRTRQPLTWHEDPADIDRLHDYCDQDVRTEAAARRRMVPLGASEQAIWVIDQRINDRGWRCDRESAVLAQTLVQQSKARASDALRELTGGVVDGVTKRNDLVTWLRETCGVDMPSVAKQPLADALMRPDLPDAARTALRLWQQGSGANVSKIGTMLERACADGRLRGEFRYHGAGPGRWTSAGVQVHNLARVRKLFEDAHLDVNVLMAQLRHGDPEWLDLLYGSDDPKRAPLGDPLALLTDAIRSFLWAAPGHDLVVSDYSNIQGRIAAWLGGESWKLDAFMAADAKTGPGLYELTAAGIYAVAVDMVDKMMRQVGKVAELALGFQGGVPAFYNMSQGYGLNLDAMYPTVWASASEEAREAAVKRWESAVKTGQGSARLMSREAWLGAEIVKSGWRLVHPGIAAFWKTQGDAVYAAIETGERQVAGPITYLVRAGFLWCRLPSGRTICYGSPKIRDMEVPWSDKTVEPAARERRPAATVATVAGDKGLQRYSLFGGLAFQNVVMGIETDLLRLGMIAVEEAGYPLVGHVHDELVAEVPRGFGSVSEFTDLMCQRPAWSAGLPVVGAGWRGKRYRKA